MLHSCGCLAAVTCTGNRNDGAGWGGLFLPGACCCMPNQGQGQQNQLLAGKQPPALPLRVWAQVPGRSEILLQDQEDLKAVLHRDGLGQRTYAISLTSAASDRCPARGRGSERRRRGKHGKRYQCDRSVDSLHDSSREKGVCYNSDVCVPLLGAGCALVL